MKIKHLLLWLLLALCMPWSAKAQDTIPSTLTVNNEGSANASTLLPVACTYLQYGDAQSQFILPQEDLADMVGGTVNKLTFYSNKNGNLGNARFSVYVEEVSESEFADFNYSTWEWDSLSVVYTGPLSIHNKMMEIRLTRPFTYYGGNLKIGFKEIQTGSSGSSLFWIGIRDAYDHSSVYFYNDNWGMHNNYAGVRPKVTFNYYVLDLPMVDVAIEDITQTTASFSWDAPSSEVTGYKYQYNRASESFVDSWEELPPTATSLTLENLAPVTDYIFRIKACYGAHESTMTTINFKTACPVYASIPYYENFDSYEVDDQWIPSVRALPDCWDYVNTTTNPEDKFPSMHHYSTRPYYAFSSPNSLQLYIDKTTLYEPVPQYVILPAMQNINGLRVKFYARAFVIGYSFTGKFKVGVMEETENGLEFIQIGDPINPNSQFQLYTIDLNSYSGNGEHIAIWMEVPGPSFDYGKVFIDDIVVEEIPQFTRPIASHGGIAGSGYYLISSPMEGPIHPNNVEQLVSANASDFDLFRFNPNPVNPGMVWENWKQVGEHYHFDFEPGKGYLYANAGNVNLHFVGTPYAGNGEVTLHYDSEASLGGWNLVGNPFPSPAYIGNKAYLRMNNAGTGFVPAATGEPIGAMEGIFVYTETDGEVLTFSTTPPTRSTDQLSVDVSKITRSGLTTPIDRAILRFGEGDELPKFQFNEESAKVYIPQNDLDYAVITAESQGEMPVNFRADENGTYTLSFSCEDIEFSYLHLFDNKTGNDVDLLSTPSYTFNATTTDYESRFKLVYATGNSVTDNSFSFFNSNGSFSIFGIEGEATLQVFDVMGRVLSTETFNGSIEKQLNVAPGVYFIRLINGDDVKTQKIVVR